MASSSELSSIYQSLLGREPDPSGIASYSPMSFYDVYNSIANSPERANYVRTLATNKYQPGLDTSLQNIQQGRNALDLNQMDINQNYDILGENLKKSAASFQERQNQLGLLQGGQTGAGLQDILVKQTGQNEQRRASALADIALKRAGLGTQETAIRNETSSNINDLVSQLMLQPTKTLQDMQDKQITMLKLADQIPEGQQIKLFDGTVITGTKKQPTSIQSIGGREYLINTQTGDKIADLGPTTHFASGGSGGSAKNPTAAELKAAAYPALLQSIRDSLKAWVQAGKPAWYTESQLIPELSAQFGAYISPSEIQALIYQTRKGAEYGGE